MAMVAVWRLNGEEWRAQSQRKQLRGCCADSGRGDDAVRMEEQGPTGGWMSPGR